ncbi:MAG: deoxyribodipyrimidine photo-lyase [Bryobacteraceae bacterium]
MQNRVRVLNDKPVRREAKYVLYWSQMNRRAQVNHALAYAIECANELMLPVLCYEGLGNTYTYANDRIHTFMVEGVPDMATGLSKMGVGYAFYLRRKRQDRNDTLYNVAADAALIVTDDYPVFIAARHNGSVPEKIDIAYHAVDSSCVIPMSFFEKREYAAYTIRPKIKKVLQDYLQPFLMPKVKVKFDLPIPQWRVEVRPGNVGGLVSECEIDHSVPPSTAYRGGYRNARKRLDHFLDDKLLVYAKSRNEPSAHATSNLSPYLHFGHISALEVALSASEHRLPAEEFLEELIVRRELAFNFARFAPDVTSLESLPDWAKKTLSKHARDKRHNQVTREQMESGNTYEPLWDATQKELLLRGKIHGYYRMYWGKKIIEWSATHEEALDIMISLHDRYALDGRDPNTYTNILWCFGLHDRPWGERPIFGMTRYLSLDGMKRKTNVNAYIDEIAELERTGEDREIYEDRDDGSDGLHRQEADLTSSSRGACDSCARRTAPGRVAFTEWNFNKSAPGRSRKVAAVIHLAGARSATLECFGKEKFGSRDGTFRWWMLVKLRQRPACWCRLRQLDIMEIGAKETD